MRAITLANRLPATIVALLFLMPPILPAQSTPSSNPQDIQAPIGVPQEEMDSHRIGRYPVVRVPWFNSAAGQIELTSIRVEAVVALDGHVVSAKAILDDDAVAKLLPDAEAVVLSLRYTPFERQGDPVSAKVEEIVELLPPVSEPTEHRPFPDVLDWNSVVITLTRTGCLGFCPSYSVEIRGDGSVLYEGKSFVAITGKHECGVPQKNVRDLVNLFRKTDYFSLPDSYIFGVTDSPTYTSIIQIGDDRKEVVDYVGLKAGMPFAVTDLEDSIDTLSNVEVWTKGNANTVSCLKREGFDFHSREAARFLAEVVGEGSADAVRDFVDAGAPLNGKNWSDRSVLELAAGEGDLEKLNVLLAATQATRASVDLRGAASQAAFSGSLAAMKLILDVGEIKVTPALAQGLLLSAASSGVPAIVKEVLKTRPNVNRGREDDGQTALIAAAANDQYGPERAGVDRVEVMRLLLRAGADPNLRDSKGMTALIHEAWDPNAVLELIRAGANVNAQSDEGYTPLNNCVDPEVARVLLEHGADPLIKDKNGKTALEIARSIGMKEKVNVIAEALSRQKN